MKGGRKNLKTGAFFLTGILAVLVVLEFAGSLPFFSSYKNLNIYFESASGLNEGTLVKMEGVRVGNVKEIKFSEDGERIKVVARIAKNTPVTTDTVASIRLVSFLGSGYINLSLPSGSGAMLVSGDSLDGKKPHNFDGIIDDAGKFLSEASSAAARLDSILEKIDEGEGAIGKLVNEDDLYHAAKDTILKANTSLDTIEDLAPVSFIATVLGVAGTFY